VKERNGNRKVRALKQVQLPLREKLLRETFRNHREKPRQMPDTVHMFSWQKLPEWVTLLGPVAKVRKVVCSSDRKVKRARLN